MATAGNCRQAGKSGGRRRTASTQNDRCPRCNGIKWVKSFTPWGCPTSTPCPRCATQKPSG